MKLLVIRRDNIGDLLCTTPLLSALRSHYPQAWIGVLTNSYAAPVLAGNPDIDAILVYEKGKHLATIRARIAALFNRIGLVLRLRRMSIDVALLPASGNQRSAERFASLSGAKRILRAADMPPPGRHEAEQSYSCAAPLGIYGTPPSMILKAMADSNIAPPPGSGPLIGMHISARKVPQRWPVERFAEFARHLNRIYSARFLIFWAPGAADDPMHPGDDEKAAELANQMAGLPFVPVPTHQLSELINGLALCDVLVCSDGGAMHIAAALGKPIVCFFGNSDAERWHPWGVPFEVLQTPSRQVTDISVDDAMLAFQHLQQTVGGSTGEGGKPCAATS